jgi:hypothetical protein
MKVFSHNMVPGMSKSLHAVARSLVFPRETFGGTDVYRTPPLALFLLLFGLVVVGQRFVTGYYQNPEARLLALNETDARLGSLMAGAPPEAQAQMRDRMVSSLLGNENGFWNAVSILLSGVGWLVFPLELWLLCSVVTQFFGGQEERAGRSVRPSLQLFLVAFLPLGVRKLLGGLLLSLRDPQAATNALTLTEFRRLSEVRFDFYSWVARTPVPGVLDVYLRLATDPFVLWMMWVLVVGGSVVYQLPFRSSLLQAILLLAILGLQSYFLGTAGLVWEI